MIIFICICVLMLSCCLTGLLRRYALIHSLIDIPNARSSHDVPTPRGGGVAIVLSFLLIVPILSFMGAIDSHTMVAYLGGGLLVALIGFADDHGHIAARWRLCGHFIAAAWILFWIGGLAPLIFPWGEVDLRWCGNFLALLFLVWMLNLYNFMDGIDGLASVEAISTCGGACLIYMLAGNFHLVGLPLVISSAVGGFLMWNFPPAKIFMGDAGSGFLGIIIGAFVLQSAWSEGGFFWSWLILLGVFVVDATWTLAYRMIRGEKIYQAHRSHAYQFASRQLSSHRAVTMGIAAINIFWLLPLAIGAVCVPKIGGVIVCIAYFPLCILAYKFRAGCEE